MFCIAKKSNVGSGIKLSNQDYVTSVCTDRETLSRVSNILTNRQIDKPTIENCDLKTCLHTSCILVSQHL